MNKEEKKAIENDISSRLFDYVNVALKFSYRDKEKHILQTIIKELQKELDKEKEKNKKLNLENQALFESINCNDDNMLARRYQKLQKENEKLKYKIEGRDCVIETQGYNEDALLETMSKKDKVIDKMAKTIAGLKLYDFNRKEYFTLEDKDEVREYFYKKASE